MGPEMDENCEPRVEIEPNGLSATLVLPASFDRAELTAEWCLSVLQGADVDPEVIDQDKLNAFIADALAAPPGPFEDVIAEGAPAVDGIDAYVDWLIEEAADDDDTTTPQPDPEDPAEQGDDESVCFYNQHIFTVVKEGDVLGKIHQEFPGCEGKDVLGNLIAAKVGQPLGIEFDESIKVTENNRLVALIDGVLIHDKRHACVSDTLEIKENIDFSTGNIDFTGSVVVKQGVKDCFTVKAEDDIEVQGLIEAATLLAGKDLRALGGFAGREQGRAEVQGNLYGKYLNAVQAQVAGDLCIEREILNSECDILGNIDSPNGRLIGGCTRVTGTVELQELGANAQPITELHIGVLPLLDPLIQELYEFVKGAIEERDDLLEQQEMLAAQIENRSPQANPAKLRKAERAMGRLQLQLDRAEPSLKKITERAEEIRTIDVLINRRIHPNALLVCGQHGYCVRNLIKGPVRITANRRGQLEYQQGDGKPRLLSEESEFKSAA